MMLSESLNKKKARFEYICMIKFGPESEIIYALPVPSSIKKHLPNSHITWITDESGIQLLEGYSDIDKFIIWKRKEWIRDFPYPHRTIPVIWEIAYTLFQLKREKIDVILDLEDSPISDLLCKSTSCIFRIMLDSEHHRNKWTKHLNTVRVTSPARTNHSGERHLSILQGIDIKEDNMSVEISIPEEIQKNADQFFQKKIPNPDGPVIGIYPGADYKNRYWQMEKFAQLADKLINDFRINCLLLWEPGELHLVKLIERYMESAPWTAYPARGKSLLALIKKCNLLIAADSVLIQMTNLVKAPVLGLFGPTAPQKRGPIGPEDRFIQGRLPCVPCERLYCDKPLCMNTITVDQALNTALGMLQKIYKLPMVTMNGED